jgi:hypothetical protein
LRLELANFLNISRNGRYRRNLAIGGRINHFLNISRNGRYREGFRMPARRKRSMQ